MTTYFDHSTDAAHAPGQVKADWARKGIENVKAKSLAVDAEKITFGCEIETALPYLWAADHSVRPGSYHHGNPAGHMFPSGWKVEHDSSINTDIQDEHGNYPHYIAAEFVSPILKGLAGVREVMAVIQTLKDAGAKVNDSTGFHVHIGTKSLLGSKASDYDMLASFVHRIVALVSQHEGALLSLSGVRSRIGNHYCNSVKATWNGKLNSYSKYHDVQNYTEMAGRYYVLNLMPLFDSRRTVEFRCFAGTLTPRKAAGYILTAVALCHRAASVGKAATFDNVSPDWTKAVLYAEKLWKVLDKFGLNSDGELLREVKISQRLGARKIAEFYNRRAGIATTTDAAITSDL